MSKAPYKTKQMTELLSYLKSVQGSHVTVNDISIYFRDKGTAVGTTTVYRQLDKMVQEGIVAKYTIDGNSSACYQYIGDRDNAEQTICYHCKCEKCGKLVHLHCSRVDDLRKHVIEQHGFELNLARTVFYGICDECQNI